MERAARGEGDDLDESAIGSAAPGELTATAPDARGAQPTTTGRPRWLLFAGLAATVFILDQLAKAWIVANVDPGRPIRLVDDLLRLVVTHNTGALFGLFRDQAGLFAIASIGVIALIVVYHGRSGHNPLLSVTLGLLLGGAIGNLADRVRLGYVIDFVDAGIGNLRFYTFNVADAAISCSLVLMLALAFVPSLGELGTDRRRARGPDA
jgi:signal peptidase II